MKRSTGHSAAGPVSPRVRSGARKWSSAATCRFEELDWIAVRIFNLNLLAALGVRIVLAFGTRAQIDALLKARKHRTRYRNGVRVTDAVALKCVKEAVGSVRADIEASLSTGLPNSPMAGADIRVASGNFVTAQLQSA